MLFSNFEEPYSNRNLPIITVDILLSFKSQVQDEALMAKSDPLNPISGIYMAKGKGRLKQVAI